MEWVMSGGQAASDQRQFRGETAYRSNYLDRLYRESDRALYPFRIPSLHPCLNEQRIEDEKSHLEMSKDLSIKLHAHKEAEFCRFECSKLNWTGTRSDINIRFGEMLGSLGFSTVSARDWNEDVLPQGYQRSSNDLVVQCGILKGKHNHPCNSIDLRIRLFMKQEPDEIFREGNFSKIIPGFGNYRGFSSEKTAIVGINALSQFIDVFVGSF